MKQIDLDRYIYKLIPDYAYIDYAEGEYWRTHMTNPQVPVYSDNLYPASGSIWYNIINIMYDTSSLANNTYRSVSYGRCLLISPVELEFESHTDEIIHQLKKYGDRYVYACFSSEDELFRSSTIKFKGNDSQIIELAQAGELPYVVELRF